MTSSNNDARRRENVLAATLAVLLGAVLLTSHAVGGALARYTASGASSDSARVALFGHNESVTFQTWNDSIKPGSTQTVYLTVSNASQNGSVSEVAQSYELELVTSGNLPIKYTLEKIDGSGKADITNVGGFTESSSKTSETIAATDGSMTFSPGSKREDTYKITAEWPADQNKPDYANIPDFLQVNINVKQID